MNCFKRNTKTERIIPFAFVKPSKMASEKPTDIFKYNLFFWKLFAIWSGRKYSAIYKCFSLFYLFVTLFIYNILLTLNLIYTPRTIETMIREVIFYFTEIAVTSKVFMILFMKDNIIDAFNLLDGEELGVDDETSKIIVKKYSATYNALYTFYHVFSNTGFASQVYVPVFLHLVFKSELDLPICKYYFLSDQVREDYFAWWFTYQTIGMYGHMMYNINVDSFMCGMLFIGVNQFKIIEHKLYDLATKENEKTLKIKTVEEIQMKRLKKILRRYNFLLKYCSLVQTILSTTMFVQFGVSSAIICVVMCGLLLPSTTETFVFMVCYLMAMTMQIFVPGLLGTQMKYASEELAFAAYNSEWLPRSESFKRNMRIFVQRANKPIVITGLAIFPLSLSTFTSILKTAYSFFTLIRSFQNE